MIIFFYGNGNIVILANFGAMFYSSHNLFLSGAQYALNVSVYRIKSLALKRL